MQKRFKWLSQYNDAIWSNFQKRASSELTQLIQDVRKQLPLKPNWMEDVVFKEMKEHWESDMSSRKSSNRIKNIVIQMLVHHYIQVVLYLID